MKSVAFALITSAGVCAPVAALDWGFETRAGYTFSDNVAQAPEGDVANILSAELTGLAEHVGRDIRLDAQLGVIGRKFLDEDYDSELQPQLRADIEWSALPDRLQLNFSDIYGQLALNPSAGSSAVRLRGRQRVHRGSAIPDAGGRLDDSGPERRISRR